jgi:hypothetical protein
MCVPAHGRYCALQAWRLPTCTCVCLVCVCRVCHVRMRMCPPGHTQAKPLSDLFPSASPDALDLLTKLLHVSVLALRCLTARWRRCSVLACVRARMQWVVCRSPHKHTHTCVCARAPHPTRRRHHAP